MNTRMIHPINNPMIIIPVDQANLFAVLTLSAGFNVTLVPLGDFDCVVVIIYSPPP